MRPARWFCSRCGKEWPAVFDRPKPPVPRFVGHDESKARQAARRAEALAARQVDLAIQRAGMSRKHVAGRRREVTGPVPVETRRLAG
jgi:hypothetical protein